VQIDSPQSATGHEPTVEGEARRDPERRRLFRDRIILLTLLLGAWELGVRVGWLDPLFFAAPTQVVRAFGELAVDAKVRQTFIDTVVVVGAAFGIGAGSALLVGTWLGLVKTAHRIFLPFISIAMSTPKIIFLPLFVVALGTGSISKVAYAGMSAFFFTVPNVAASVRMLDPRLVMAVESLGASRRQRFTHLVIPGSLPGVVTGLWFGMKHALLSVLVAELFISQGGIGFWINRYTSSFQVDKVFALILALAIVAVGLGWMFRVAERRLDRWRPAYEGT